MTIGIRRATHTGVVRIGNINLPCAVLEDGERVFTQQGIFLALGRTGNPATNKEEVVLQPPVFLSVTNLKPFTPNELTVGD